MIREGGEYPRATGQQALALDSCPKVKADIPAQAYEQELIVVTPRDSTMHTLTGLGPWIFERLDGRPLSGLLQELTEAFEVSEETAASDLLEFVRALVVKGIVEL